MLKKRIIPCLDVKSGRVVKGVSFKELKDAGNPAELGAFYMSEGADELVFLDITASSEKRGTMLQWVKEVADSIFIPFTVGGGISSLEDAVKIVSLGADKISLNTAAIDDPDLISDCSEVLGRQAVVTAIDCLRTKQDHWEVYKQGGTIATGLEAGEWARIAETKGTGEILLTSIDQDGRQNGYDLLLLEHVSSNVSVPVIASGGAGEMVHFRDCLASCADAALAASVFHFGRIKIKDLKEYLAQEYIPVRMEGE
jgi:cyclase